MQAVTADQMKTVAVLFGEQYPTTPITSFGSYILSAPSPTSPDVPRASEGYTDAGLVSCTSNRVCTLGPLHDPSMISGGSRGSLIIKRSRGRGGKHPMKLTVVTCSHKYKCLEPGRSHLCDKRRLSAIFPTNPLCLLEFLLL